MDEEIKNAMASSDNPDTLYIYPPENIYQPF
jgi:hypothetical protein